MKKTFCDICGREIIVKPCCVKIKIFDSTFLSNHADHWKRYGLCNICGGELKGLIFKLKNSNS